MVSNLMAILLQALAARLGIASGRDLAQACRDHYSRPVTVVLWVLCEIAIAACDLAEVIGAAIALNLLFNLPLIWGVILTSLDVLVVLYLQNRGFRYVEARRRPDSPHRRVVRHRALSREAGSRADARRLHPAGRRRAQPGDALHRHRHPGRDGDAAQPVSALVDRPNAQVSRFVRGQAGGNSLRDD
jgi:manganese transport protein